MDGSPISTGANTDIALLRNRYECKSICGWFVIDLSKINDNASRSKFFYHDAADHQRVYSVVGESSRFYTRVYCIFRRSYRNSIYIWSLHAFLSIHALPKNL